MHGEDDQVVPINHILESKDFLLTHGFNITTKIFKNCEPRNPTEGLSIGLEFLKKNL